MYFFFLKTLSDCSNICRVCSSEGYIYYTATVLREKFLIEHFQTFSSVKGKILILPVVKVFE